MKKRNNTMKQLVATSAIALMGFVANGQILETMGTVGSGTQTSAARESAGNFDLVALTYTGSADMRTTTPVSYTHLFRTMEDASGVDLDWFWRGWFYSTEYVDISLDLSLIHI